MGITVDLGDEDLRCRSEEDAKQAAHLINGSLWMSPYHLQVEPEERSGTWELQIEHFQGDHWLEEEARKVWFSIAPHMADGASLEFEGEGRERWRIRWAKGRCFEDWVHEIVWTQGEEITAPAGEEA